MRRALPAAWWARPTSLPDRTFCPIAPPAWMSINLHRAREQIVDRGSAALVVNRFQLDSGGLLEELECEAAGGGGPGRTVIQLRAVRFCIGDELGNRLHLRLGCTTRICG